MGGGFSLFYHPTRYIKPFSSFGCAFRPSNYEYIASILNLEFQPFHINFTISEDIIWDKIFKCIKENITLNQPVLVNLDTTSLFGDHIGIKLPVNIWKLIPVYADHAIVVVGYNESNQTICYNDPQYSIYGDEKQGSYIWVHTDLFKSSFSKFTENSPNFPSSYRIKSYKKPINISNEKENIIEQAYNRNIKRLQGNYRYYISDTDYPDSYNISANETYGINASIEIKKIFGENIKIQLYTILQYKLTGKLGIKNTFFTILDKILKNYFEKDFSYTFDNIIPGYKNVYNTIAYEKMIISNVLYNYSNLSQKYQVCADLLINESEQWLKLSEYNKILLNKGLFITIPKALIILNQMENIMNEIIQIEQNIISLE